MNGGSNATDPRSDSGRNLLPVLPDNRLALAELPRYCVGVVGEDEKILSSLSRKFGCRSTITDAGAGGSLADGTSTGIFAGGCDAQDDAPSASSSNVTVFLSGSIGY